MAPVGFGLHHGKRNGKGGTDETVPGNGHKKSGTMGSASVQKCIPEGIKNRVWKRLTGIADVNKYLFTAVINSFSC